MRMYAKKFLALVLALVMVFALSATAFAYSKGDVLVCTGNDVNVRSGAGTKYKSIGTLDKGDKVTFLAKSGSKWTKVEYEGETAYVYTKYLASAGSSSGDTSTSSTTLYATTDVRVRAGAGTSYKTLGWLEEDEAVTRLGTSGKWTKVSWNNQTAYVYTKYLTSTVPEGADETKKDTTASTSTVTTKFSTYVYRGPGASYGTLYTVAAGTQLSATGVVSGDFTQVNTPYGLGYVQTSTVTGTVSPKSSVGTVTANTYLYQAASLYAAKYNFTVPKGAQVTCTGVVSGSFMQVTYLGYTGYIHSDYINNATVNTNTGVDGQYVRYISTTVATVYETAPVTNIFGVTSTGKTLGTLTSGTRVTCTAVSGSYTKIVYGTGYGYVATSCLSTSAPSSTTTNATGTYVTVKKGAVIINANDTTKKETVTADTVVVLVQNNYLSGYSLIRDAANTLYLVSPSYLSSSSKNSTTVGSYVTINKGATIYPATNVANSETTTSDVTVILVQNNYWNGLFLVRDAAGTQYLVAAKDLKGYSSSSSTTAGGNNTVKSATAYVYNSPTAANSWGSAALAGLVTVLKQGDKVQCTGTVSNGYAQIVYGSTYAYIATSDLTYAVGSSTSSYVTIKAGSYVYKTTNVNTPEYVSTNTLVTLVSSTSPYTGYATVRDANGVLYYVLTSNLK